MSKDSLKKISLEKSVCCAPQFSRAARGRWPAAHGMRIFGEADPAVVIAGLDPAIHAVSTTTKAALAVEPMTHARQSQRASMTAANVPTNCAAAKAMTPEGAMPASGPNCRCRETAH
jgi:hypothetical protein